MKPFSERPLLLLLAAVQFTHIMDFMILMPLGPQLMRDLSVSPGQFSSLVAAYSITAGIVGLLFAPFIDRFDRRPLILIAYAGFAMGTLACALSTTFHSLLIARAICGGFGGVSGALVLAIVSDLVPPERRATGMGIIMTAFAMAAALGVPFGLFLAGRFDWEAPFFMTVGLAVVVWTFLALGLPSVRGHMGQGGGSRKSFVELITNPNANRALLFMGALIFGHFAIIPLLSAYLVANVGVPENRIFLVYLVGGVLTVFTSPVVGRLADRVGHRRVYAVLVSVASLVTLAISNSGPMPLWGVLALAGMFFVFASGRFVPGQAIMSLAVQPRQRGAFMSLTSCTRDLGAGITTAMSGWIVTTAPDGRLIGYHWLGWLAVGANVASLLVLRRVRAVEGGGGSSANTIGTTEQPNAV
jgi:DHA1 family inner membrane transport protein